MNRFCPLDHAKSICPYLVQAVRCAQAAGNVVRDGYLKAAEIEQKGIGDLVSEVDRQADRAACEVLADSPFPILSEELNPDREEASEMWIVDPLDASSAFLMKAGPQYPSVLVALRQKSQTDVGVVYFPLVDQWYYAKRGHAAWHNGKRLVCDSEESLSDIWVEMNQYGNAAHETAYFAELRSRLRSPDGARLVTSNVPHSGVAMEIATGNSCLAAAIHDNNPAHPKQAAWDIAAAQIIMEEAGGVFLGPTGKRTDPFIVEPIIVARSKSIAQQIIDLSGVVSS